MDFYLPKSMENSLPLTLFQICIKLYLHFYQNWNNPYAHSVELKSFGSSIKESMLSHIKNLSKNVFLCK